MLPRRLARKRVCSPGVTIIHRWATQFVVLKELSLAAERSQSVAMSAVATIQKVGYDVPYAAGRGCCMRTHSGATAYT